MKNLFKILNLLDRCVETLKVNSQGTAESSLPPAIPEKNQELTKDLETKNPKTSVSYAANPLYGKEVEVTNPESKPPMKPPEERPSLDNIYETVFVGFQRTATLSQEKPLEVSKSNFKLLKQLGSGQFGRVSLVKTVKLSQADLKMGTSSGTKISINVAVKFLKTGASEPTRKKFEKEYKFMFNSITQT